jgi:hypothetical protein
MTIQVFDFSAEFCLSVCRTHAHYSLWHAHYCPLILFIENWTHDGDRIPTCSRDVLNAASSSTSTDAKINGIRNCKFWSAPWKLRCLFYAVMVTFDLTAHRCYNGAFHTWVTLCMHCGHVQSYVNRITTCMEPSAVWEPSFPTTSQ